MPQYAWVDTSPFLLRRGGSSACLLVHGFAGTPAEVRPLGQRLSAQGLTTYAPVLPGHASTSEALLRHDRHEWLNTVTEAHRWLVEEHDHVFVAGLSMGSLLAAKLANRHAVRGLIMMAPALVARDRRIRFAGAMSLVRDFVPEARVAQGGLVDPQAWKRMWHYERRALRALSELYRLQVEARLTLPEVFCPTLVLHGLRDQTVPERSAMDVYRLLGTTAKELVWLERSGHCLTADGERDYVAEKILGFIDQAIR